MALKLNERYPQRWDSPSNDYPQGAFKNLTELGEQDGSYLEQDWLNDYSGFFGALLRNAEMTPDGTIDTAQKSQFYDALMQLMDAELATKFDKSDLVNTSGQSTDKVMSQKAVTDQLNAIESSHGLGYGQEWFDVTDQRTVNTTYTNNTGKPIFVAVSCERVVNASLSVYINESLILRYLMGSGVDGNSRATGATFIVPPGATYRANFSFTIQIWSELR